MAEKRKLLAEMDKCYKKIDEGVELFEETMTKMQEANSENQREKFQDDLKKEIKKLQRLREQIKGWQNSSDIKDKEKLTHYRKVIEQRMEQFKDIERENKTKPHSKQGLSAEEKLDPREKEKSETVEWLQTQIRHLEDEIDKTEAKIETLGTTTEPGKKRGKKDEPKKSDKELQQKKMDDLKKHWDRMKFHISKLEVCMRLVNNETLDSRVVMDALREPLEMYIEALDPENENDPEDLDPEGVYEDLDLGSYAPQLGTVTAIGTLDDSAENSNSISSPSSSPTPPAIAEDATVGTVASVAVAGVAATTSSNPAVIATKQRHSSGEVNALMPKTPSVTRSTPATPLKLTNQTSAESSSMSSPPPATPPPPPGMPYAVAAGLGAKTKPGFSINVVKPVVAAVAESPTMRAQSLPMPASPMAATAAMPESPIPISSASSTVTTEPTSAMIAARESSSSPMRSSTDTAIPVTRFPFINTNGSPSSHEVMTLKSMAAAQTSQTLVADSIAPPQTASHLPPGMSTMPAGNSLIDSSSPSASIATVTQLIGAATSTIAMTTNASDTSRESTSSAASWAQAALDVADLDQAALRQVLRMGVVDQQPRSREPQTAHVPPWLGASPLGRVPATSEHVQQAAMLECALSRAPLQMDSERPRSYLPKMLCPTASYYPQTVPASADSLEYYLRLSPETLFFTFYYMEGSRAQLLAAKALKKLSWRFHTKYLMWFQRHEEPKQITDDYEQGTYVYFDFEKWSQRKKEQFTFEYRYLEDKDFD